MNILSLLFFVTSLSFITCGVDGFLLVVSFFVMPITRGLSNTKTVYYCVRMDQASISVDSTMKSAIKDSIQYWKSEFERFADGSIEGRFDLGT